MSQYYYEGDQLVQDDQVPFVKTISRLTRFADGSMQENKLPIEMPSLQGAGSECFVNDHLPVTASGIIQLSQTSEDTILIGHIFGGIVSLLLNPFNSNQTSATSADHRIYAVRLVKEEATAATLIEGQHALTLKRSLPRGMYWLTLIFDHQYYTTQALVKE